MGTKELNRRLDRAAPAEKDGEYIFSEKQFRRAVERADKFLKECIDSHRNDPPLTESEEKEAEEVAARLIAWWREEYKDENARLVNPIHV